MLCTHCHKAFGMPAHSVVFNFRRKLPHCASKLQKKPPGFITLKMLTAGSAHEASALPMRHLANLLGITAGLSSKTLDLKECNTSFPALLVWNGPPVIGLLSLDMLNHAAYTPRATLKTSCTSWCSMYEMWKEQNVCVCVIEASCCFSKTLPCFFFNYRIRFLQELSNKN